MSYGYDSELLNDVRLLWGGERIASVWTEYNTIGKVYQQMRYIFPGTSGEVYVADPDGSSLQTLIYAPLKHTVADEPDVVEIPPPEF